MWYLSNDALCRPVKRGPGLLQLDEQQQQMINKRRLISSFNNSKATLNASMNRQLNTIAPLRGCVSVCLCLCCHPAPRVCLCLPLPVLSPRSEGVSLSASVCSAFVYLLVHGQVTIIFVVSVGLSVCLFVCLCRVFLSRLWSDFDQTNTYVICLGLIVSPRILGLCNPWGLGDP